MFHTQVKQGSYTMNCKDEYALSNLTIGVSKYKEFLHTSSTRPEYTIFTLLSHKCISNIFKRMQGLPQASEPCRKSHTLSDDSSPPFSSKPNLVLSLSRSLTSLSTSVTNNPKPAKAIATSQTVRSDCVEEVSIPQAYENQLTYHLKDLNNLFSGSRVLDTV